MSNRDTILRKIRNPGTLPSLPAILVRLLEACEKEDSSLLEIAALIGQDPALAGKVLQLVNSAAFGLQRTFTSVDQAVVYLGAASIKNIAVTSSVHQVFDRQRLRGVAPTLLAEFWWQSLLTATLARRIAVQSAACNPDEAYLAGFLLDIGKLALLNLCPEEYPPIAALTAYSANPTNSTNSTSSANPTNSTNSVNSAYSTNATNANVSAPDEQRQREMAELGISHPEVGALLVEGWRLGPILAEAIGCHHEPWARIEEALPLVAVAALANRLAEQTNGGAPPEPAPDGVLAGLDGAELAKIVSGAAEAVQAAADELRIPVRQAAKNDKGNGDQSAPSNQSEKSADKDGGTAAAADDDSDAAGLCERMRGMTLLAGFLEDLNGAESDEEFVAVFEEAMRILYGLGEVLFLVPDRQGNLLKGLTSERNRLQQLSRDLALPLAREASRIVRGRVLRAPEILAAADTSYLADRQILAGMGVERALLIPLRVQKKPSGVVLLGLPANPANPANRENDPTLLGDDQLRLIRVLAQQVGLRLHLQAVQRRRAEELEAERVAAVRMTARKFAHEINNPLGIISNYLTTMKLQLPSGHQIHNELTVIGEEIARISTMVAQMDIFSRPGKCSLVPTDINAVVGEAIAFIRAGLAAGTTVDFAPAGALPPVASNRDKLKQILLNLLKNATEAMAGGGRIEVRTNYLSSPEGAEAGSVVLTVSDNGPGLPATVRARLFQPLVSTKGGGHSGLGLSIVNRAVQELGGQIACAEAAGGGTVFTITLPCRQRPT